MTVQQLIERLKELPQDKMVITQVVAQDGSAWNCWFDFNDIPNSSLVQLRVSHSELKTLSTGKND